MVGIAGSSRIAHAHPRDAYGPVDDLRKYRFADVEMCIAGNCIGQDSPCLCHVDSLRHLARYNGHLVRRQGRVPGVSQQRKGTRSR